MSYGIDVWLLHSKMWQQGSSINKALGYQDSLVKSLLFQIKESDHCCDLVLFGTSLS